MRNTSRRSPPESGRKSRIDGQPELVRIAAYTGFTSHLADTNETFQFATSVVVKVHPQRMIRFGAVQIRELLVDDTPVNFVEERLDIEASFSVSLDESRNKERTTKSGLCGSTRCPLEAA